VRRRSAAGTPLVGSCDEFFGTCDHLRVVSARSEQISECLANAWVVIYYIDDMIENILRRPGATLGDRIAVGST
jgi:hypothetical protein